MESMTACPPSRVPPPGELAALSADAAPDGGAPRPDPVISSSQLLRGRKTVQIEHNGALYMLRTTKLGKLILTK